MQPEPEQVVGLVSFVDPFLQLVLDLAVEQPRVQPGGVHRTRVVEPRTNEQLEQLLERSTRGQRPQASGPDTERITSSGTPSG
jgi:hypothetical protein